jgi:hypothetical protein
LPGAKKKFHVVYYSGHGVNDPKGELHAVLDRPNMYNFGTILSSIAKF